MSFYNKGSLGHTLQSLKKLGIPLPIVEEVTVDITEDRKTLKYGSKVFAYFDDKPNIEEALFHFTDEYKVYKELLNKMVIQPDNSLRPEFKLSLDKDGVVCLEIFSRCCCEDLYTFLTDMFTINSSDDRYWLTSKAGAFFAKGEKDKNADYYKIEFWKPEGAQAWLQYFNDHYKRS